MQRQKEEETELRGLAEDEESDEETEDTRRDRLAEMAAAEAAAKQADHVEEEPGIAAMEAEAEGFLASVVVRPPSVGGWIKKPFPTPPHPAPTPTPTPTPTPNYDYNDNAGPLHRPL